MQDLSLLSETYRSQLGCVCDYVLNASVIFILLILRDITFGLILKSDIYKPPVHKGLNSNLP